MASRRFPGVDLPRVIETKGIPDGPVRDGFLAIDQNFREVLRDSNTKKVSITTVATAAAAAQATADEAVETVTTISTFARFPFKNAAGVDVSAPMVAGTIPFYRADGSVTFYHAFSGLLAFLNAAGERVLHSGLIPGGELRYTLATMDNWPRPSDRYRSALLLMGG